MSDASRTGAAGPGGSRRQRIGRGAVVGRRLAVEVVRLVHDRTTRRSGIPASVSGLDAEHLAGLLGLPVTAVEVLEGTEGTTDRVRLALSGDGAPPSVFVKMAAGATAIRLFGNLADLGGDEVRFYRDVRPTLDIEAPEVHGLDHEPRTKRFVLVLEDLQARGCTFTELVDAVDIDRAGAALDTLARLHGATTIAAGGPTSTVKDGAGAGATPARLSWLRANGADPLLPLYAAALGRLTPRLARDHPALFTPGGRMILAAYPAVARTLDEGPQAILHGDPHPGNWYYDGARAGLLDWQAVRRGNPLRDVAYFLVLALDPRVRRAHERDLLEHYRARLAEHGGPELDAEPAWRTYRSMAAYPYVAATLTAGFGGLQSDETALVGLRRAAAAIADLDTHEALAPLGRSGGRR